MEPENSSTTPSGSGAISLVIVDDHPLILGGLVSLLQSAPAFSLLGQATNGLEAVEQYERHRPDVVLMDLNMPECGGVEAIGRIRRIDANARIIILTTYEGEEDVHRGLLAGARAYLLKNAGFEQIVHCIHRVAADGKYLPPAIAAKLANRIGANQLSPRELEILAHLSDGKSNKLIARAADIGVGTVKFHVNNILSKLNVSCRTEAASVALKRGLIHSHASMSSSR
jgi:DNA-binding NarL/FixJ family response regulator